MNCERTKKTLRRHESSCDNCRYHRFHCSIHKNKDGVVLGSTYTGECLLLGRTLSIGDRWFVESHDADRICDGWKKSPPKWQHHTDKNPHSHDAYISREQLERIRKRTA